MGGRSRVYEGVQQADLAANSKVSGAIASRSRIICSGLHQHAIIWNSRPNFVILGCDKTIKDAIVGAVRSYEAVGPPQSMRVFGSQYTCYRALNERAARQRSFVQLRSEYGLYWEAAGDVTFAVCSELGSRRCFGPAFFGRFNTAYRMRNSASDYVEASKVMSAFMIADPPRKNYRDISMAYKFAVLF